jgi:hypothetical protein
MTDIQGIRDDLAFMREVAQGAQGTLCGGGILAAAGLIYGGASLVQWLMLSGRAPASDAAILWTWGLAAVAFYAVLFFELRRLKRERGAGLAARGAGVTWWATGLAFFAIVLGFGVANWRLGSPVIWAAMPVVAFALYGAGWTVAAHLSGKRWVQGVAWASFAFAVAVAGLSGSPDIWLAYGLGLILLLGAPGLALLRRA